MNIQQIILPADDRHALVNKHAHKLCPRSSLLQSGLQCILQHATLATPPAAPWLWHAIQGYCFILSSFTARSMKKGASFPYAGSRLQ